MMVGGGHDRLWYRIWKTVGKDRPELEDMILDEPTLRVVIDRVGHDQQVKTCTILTDWMKDWTREECRAKLLAEEVAAGGVSFIDEVAERAPLQIPGCSASHRHVALRQGAVLRLPVLRPPDSGPGQRPGAVPWASTTAISIASSANFDTAKAE